MGNAEPIPTCEDDWHQRRRRFAVPGQPRNVIDLEAERLRRLADAARDTRDP